jgi:hypothetical protein
MFNSIPIMRFPKPIAKISFPMSVYAPVLQQFLPGGFPQYFILTVP